MERTYTGQVVFWDAFTGYQISLSSWQLRGMSKEEYERVKADFELEER
ncbi:MAG: hypothetical protein ACF8GE_01885 [Phycisphaerales bacterium JB043]